MNIEKRIYRYFINDNSNNPLVIIFPGGGFSFVARKGEGSSVAKEFNKYGYNVIIYDYLVKDSFINTITSVNELFLYLLRNKDKNNININNGVILVGLSAGAYTLLSYFKDKNNILINNKNIDTKGILLGYPLISIKNDLTHKGSKDFILKGINNYNDDDNNINRLYSLEEYYDDINNIFNIINIPIFIYSFKDDPLVSVYNSRIFNELLTKYKSNKYKYIEYEGSYHGVGSAFNTPAQDRIKEAIDFLND